MPQDPYTRRELTQALADAHRAITNAARVADGLGFWSMTEDIEQVFDEWARIRSAAFDRTDRSLRRAPRPTTR